MLRDERGGSSDGVYNGPKVAPSVRDVGSSDKVVHQFLVSSSDP